jgi:site-specific recombinase XerD
MNVEQVSADFLAYCDRERHLAPHTLAAYRQDLAEFCRYFPGRAIDEIMGSELVAYSQHLTSSRKLAPATVKRRFACLRMMFSKLTRQRLVRESPFATIDLRIRIPTRLPRCLGTGETRALLRAARSESRTTHLATVLLLATGIRVSELASIQTKDIDLEQGSVRIRGKGSRERLVFLSDEKIIAQICDYIVGEHPPGELSIRLLLNARGRPVTASCLRRRIKALGRKAHLTRTVTPHMLRHTAATALMEAGVDIRFVQRLLGHQAITTTQLYTHVSDRALKAAISAANVISQLSAPLGAVMHA